MSALWAITSFFNPAGYHSRLHNYRIFRKRLSVPLVSVELAYGERFELGPGDAERLIQVRGHHVLWQKERLLNLALAAVPAGCRKIAWLDADIVFEDPEWALKADRLLNRRQLVQLFRYRLDLDRGATVDEPFGKTRISVASAAAEGPVARDELVNRPGLVPGRPSTGLAWAARRELFEERGFYDAAILGLGDRLMTTAALGVPEWGAENGCMNDRHREYFYRWAVPFGRSLDGAVDFLDGTILHPWHGETKHRRGMERYADFARFDFDPEADLALDEHGCWRWSSDKPEMHRHVRDYFFRRREDGEVVTKAASEPAASGGFADASEGR